ncbi:putative DNA mismatch repair protein MSH5 [Leptomonas pyrrhocoris]|uniref:Putative DNA mismatch repair protein MSH5 n=1 Tax=Leptomonas pyrrhocoris TaxID=157538 RepID=A0A0M9G1L8_LEPPY|nr:putative DNA mismatch repair protein MSH5 [Leptomonas pyrrhocoris]KPA80550.1 putative DNA mismatch repair protein MSH5 [Leptomonas pyrrhocoris]|eukprot:XP_015658989.1 putative DNA mismatch repair protein MSH5 [Leptomonas pyrrhocoris]
MNDLCGAATSSDAWDDDGVASASSSDADAEEADDDAAGASADAEVTALCWSGASVGVARYLCAECRIEVFEAPVYVVAGEAVRRRTTGFPSARASSSSFHRRGDGGGGSEGEVRILVYEDIPPSLLWLVRYFEVHRPLVLLPHTGSDALSDVVGLLAARLPLEVSRLSATSAFNAAEALPRLATMYPAKEAELANRFHAQNTAMMRAMAALLQFVAAGQSNVADVVERGVPHALYLEDTCAEALQITRAELHPSSAQGRGRAKEGLSLRGLLSTAQSSLGRAMLRQWIALPCCDLAEIEARQSVVAFFVHVEHHGIATQLRTALHHVRSTSHIFTTMRSGRALRKHYVSLYRTIRGVVQVQRLLSTVAHEVGRLYVLWQSIAAEPLVGMAEALARTIVGVTAPRATIQNRVSEGSPMIDPVNLAGCGNGTVRIHDGVDAVLDELRLRLHELRLSLQSKAEDAFELLPWELRARLSLRCVYAVPHGYLLCVPAADLIVVVREYVLADVPETPEERNAESQNDATRLSDPEEGSDGEADPVSDADGTASPPAANYRTPDTAATSSVTARAHVCRFMLDAFQWQFHHETQSGEYCFKSAAMEELDTWVGDLQRRVQQREQQVRRELDTALLYSSLHLLRPTRALGELDCLLSFARVSAQEGWCRPEMLVPESRSSSPERKEEREEAAAMNKVDEGHSEEEEEEGVLEIANGWHPLLSRQLGLQQLVPFSLHLRTSTDRVCLVLGVNGSGKSVLMNAVAHIVFLAHVGCHVPAAAARMSLVNGIFAPSSLCVSPFGAHAALTSTWSGPFSYHRGYGSQTGEEGTGAVAASEAEAAQSSFYGECVALHRVLHHVAGQQRAAATAAAGQSVRCADPTAGRALVLLDEFGRGTAPEDGCALLKGTLRYFATGGGASDTAAASCSQWRRAPLVLCATHLLEMLESSSPARASSSGTAPDAAVGEGNATINSGEGDAAWTDRLRRSAPSQAMPSFIAPEKDAPLPLPWIKVYTMETLTTYAPEDGSQGTTCENENTVECAQETYCADVEASAPRRLPVDLTPTYHPVCITPHTSHRRWEDWQRHAGAHLDAGPALGRQCGLDSELLACWESALRVLRSSH